MSGYDDIDTNSGSSKYITIEPSKSVDINILTKREDMVISGTHWTGEKYVRCTKENCSLCKENNKPSVRYAVNVMDRADDQVKIYQFGTNVMIGIKEIAKVLKEDGQTIHDIDLRVSRVSEKPVRYNVIQRKKAADIPPDIKPYDLEKELNIDEVPF